MIWLTWRQHRIEILVIGLILLVFAAVLLATGVNIASESQNFGVTTCVNQQIACLQAKGAVANNINNILESSAFYGICIILPLVLPLLAGMFIGAPAIAREFEQGTYRLIWTQGISWNRWLLAKISLLTCMVLCAFGILWALFSWWSFFIPNVTMWIRNIDFSNHFDGWGVVSIAYALFALLLGIFTGTVMRKTLPAMAITLVIFVLVRILIVNFWRPYYLPPVAVTTTANTSTQIPDGSWILSEDLVNREGQPVSVDALQICNVLLSSHPTSTETAQYERCIINHGFQNKTVYQPTDRFWLLQGIESSIYVLLAAMLFALTFCWTKYRILRI